MTIRGRLPLVDLKVGDIVWLRSGSCALTVDQIMKHPSNTRVNVGWFQADTSTYKTANISQDSLTRTPTQNRKT